MTPPLVLVAEDDPDVRALAELVLRGAGLEVLAVGDGRIALDAAALSAPAVVVLDVSMPGMDGLRVTRELRSRPEGADVPILLLTARVGEADRRAGREAGADDQLDKPFSPAVLVERVLALLSGRGPSEMGPQPSRT